MLHTSGQTRSLGLGAALVAAMLFTLGTPAIGSTAAPAAAPAQDIPADPQAADPGESFAGYVGYNESGTSAAGAADDSTDKTEGLGPIGSTEGHTPDVPGAADAQQAPDPEPDLSMPTAPDPTQVAEVRKAIADEGSARVLVMTSTPLKLEADLSARGIRSQHQAIADSLDGLQATLAGTGSQRLLEFKVVPSAVYQVTADGLAALIADPEVASITLDGEVQGQLDSSTDVIDSDLLNLAGVLGNNFEGSTTGRYEVAIIDSGVDGQHNAFTGRIVRQACFVTDASCPGATNSFIGAPGGEECTHSSDCDHGTHVGGIASGSFFTGGHEGVARGSNLVAIKVAQDNPNSSRWTAFFSSIDSALQHVINLKNSTNPNLVSVNLSIGGGLFTHNNPACNAVDPNTNVLFGQLQALGVAVVVAAGNDGSNTQMSFPGCLSNAFAIGATSDADVPAGFTNSSAGLRWWAPGVSITAPVPTGNSEGTKDGTSMAAPHVAGSFALLRECVDGNGVPQTNAAAAADLDATGVNVTRNGVTRKRINVLDAATRNVNNNDFAFPEVFAGAGPINDFDFNVCADSEPGEPGPFSVDNSVWWTWTPPAVGTATISTEDFGSNVTTFDTSLTVYTGDTLGTLTPVAADDDSGTGLRSLAVFPVNGGTTYRIKVDGFAASNGLLNLHMQLGPPPQCFGVPATLVGTTGNDVINGTAGNDVVVAGTGNDTINGLDGNDRICAGAGEDTVNGGNGADFVLGDPGSDVINGDADNDTLVGNAGGGDLNDVGDTITGGTGNDFLDGWVGNDTLDGGDGDDTLSGAADNDVMAGRAGDDAYLGGTGVDTAEFGASPAAVTADLGAGTATGEGADTLDAVENLTGSAFNDVFTGDAAANTLDGASGNDRLDGMAENDRLLGGGGDDVMIGRLGNDEYNGGANVDTASYVPSATAVNANLTTGTATGEGNDTLAATENLTGSVQNDILTGDGASNLLNGGAGNDRMLGVGGNDVMIGRLGNDEYNGGANVDTASFAGSAAAVNANLTAGTATGEGNDTLLTTENINGSGFNDVLTGNAVANTLSGGNGNDRMDGMSGNDRLLGAAGNDVMVGRLGNDQYDGGVNVDTASFVASAAAVNANLTAGTATGEGNDTLAATENIIGSPVNDTLTGNAVPNTLEGRNGNDRLFGLAGNDRLFGGVGTDRCDGGIGADAAASCELVVSIP